MMQGRGRVAGSQWPAVLPRVYLLWKGIAMPLEDDRSSFVQWKDIQNVQDQTVYAFSLIVQKMRVEVTRLINSVIGQADVKPLSQSNFVSLVMLFRVRESILSIQLLISKGLARDAAMLLTGLIESRLEMQYVAANPFLADDWITGNRNNEKPWGIPHMITRLYEKPARQEEETANYNRFRKMQYNDPMGNQPNIPLQEEDVISASENELADSLYGATTECYLILKSAVADFSDSGFTVAASIPAIEELNELNKNLLSLKKNQPAPKIKKYYPGE